MANLSQSGRLSCKTDQNHLVVEHRALPAISKAAVLSRADELLPKYREVIASISPEAGFGGIWESEMFLFYAAVQALAPRQILESGRARGKSTLILARCFPESRIISVEFDRQSENAAVAEAKLKSLANVDVFYGDSREIFPKQLQSGDAVLIDGPKEFRAVKLVLDLLRTRKPCAVFVHDFPQDSLWRKFVERHWSNAFFGDDPAFDRFRVLDQERDPRPAQHRRGYGIFACLPGELPAPFWRLQIGLFLTHVLGRVF
jgi:predicted O-methyltransferase YrrM